MLLFTITHTNFWRLVFFTALNFSKRFRTVSSAFSRMEQVLTNMRSAVSIFEVVSPNNNPFFFDGGVMENKENDFDLIYSHLPEHTLQISNLIFNRCQILKIHLTTVGFNINRFVTVFSRMTVFNDNTIRIILNFFKTQEVVQNFFLMDYHWEFLMFSSN